MIFYAYFFCCLSQNNYLCMLIFSLLLNMQSHPTWVRGLKLEFADLGKQPTPVAPYVGAWIETLKNKKYNEFYQSHPTWVRGLKLTLIVLTLQSLLSHPTWVRGLKLQVVKVHPKLLQVAPYVGAWIETGCNQYTPSFSFVAPYVGAWIETSEADAMPERACSRTLRGCVD